MMLSSAAEANRFIFIDGQSPWTAALTDGHIQPVDTAEWYDYMNHWSTYPQTGHTYSQPNLYVYPGNPCSQDANDPTGPGLVMAWASSPCPVFPCFYDAAWKYNYFIDPDMSNSIITVTVFPPLPITLVSLGLKDVNGNIRGWYWNVPVTLPSGVADTVSIDTSIVAANAATPVADGFTNNPGFDISQVVDILFSEDFNGTYYDYNTIPPQPGTTVKGPWNAWQDVTVTPEPNQTTEPNKWSQPAVEIDPGRFYGWDEKSLDSNQPLLADDWKCTDKRPITDVHWWGSFLNWTYTSLPAQAPVAFHLGIWTDVPASPNDTNSFSHPGKMVWEYICTNYQVNFVGYDKDPRQIAGVPPIVQDSCFKFNCTIPQSLWFYQKPDPNTYSRVYWLSIAAIYSTTGQNPQYPWGWKTRPHFFKDAAVRIKSVNAPWPPVLNSNWVSGNKVQYPKGTPWDLAFELTTNSSIIPPPVDYNGDGIVDFQDFAIFAEHWLEICCPPFVD